MEIKVKRLITQMQTREGASLAQIDEAMSQLGFVLPEDFQEFLLMTNGASGFVGESSFVTFWRIEELFPFNQAYRANTRVPGLCLFGSTGGGDALAFDTQNRVLPIIIILPFVPMDRVYAKTKAQKFSDLFSPVEKPVTGSRSGEELVEITPVALGGSPTSLENKMTLDRPKHIQYVNYWNDLIDSVRGRTR